MTKPLGLGFVDSRMSVVVRIVWKSASEILSPPSMSLMALSCISEYALPTKEGMMVERKCYRNKIRSFSTRSYRSLDSKENGFSKIVRAVP